MPAFDEEAGKGAEALITPIFASTFPLPDSFLASILKCRQTTSDGWRRKTGGSVKLAGLFLGNFRR